MGNNTVEAPDAGITQSDPTGGRPEATLDAPEDGMNLTHQLMGDNALEVPDAGITQSDTEQSTQQLNPSLGFTRWSPTLLEITKAIEELAQLSSEKVTPLSQVCVSQ